MEQMRERPTQYAIDLPGSEMDNLAANASTSDHRNIDSTPIDELGSPAPHLRLSGWKWKMMHITMFLTMVLLGYDSSNSSNIQIQVYQSFRNVELLPWVVASYSLGNAATAPLARRLMGVVNPKWFLTISWLISLGGGAAAGAATNIQTVILGRILMGIGISGAYICVLTHLRLLTDHAEFARINGLIGMGFATGLICGPIVGGALAKNDHATWRWAFYLTIPWIAVLVMLFLCWFPSIKPARRVSLLRSLLEIDWVGVILHVSSLVLLITALLFSGTSWRWDSGSSIATWVVFGCVLTFYILQQTFCWFTTPENRIFPVSIAELRVGFLASVCTSCSGAAYGVPLYYLPLLYGFTRGDDPIQVGVHLLPYLCVFIAFSMIGGILLPRVRYYALFYLVGGLLITVGAGAMMAINEQTSLSMVMGFSTLIGAGVGLTFQLGTATLGVAIPASLRVDSVVAMNQGQYVGITIAVSTAGCIFQNEGFKQLQNALGGLGFSDTDIRNTLAGLQSPILQDGDAQVVTLATSILSAILIKLFYLVVAAGILMQFCAYIMKWEALDFGFQTDSGRKSEEDCQ